MTDLYVEFSRKLMKDYQEDKQWGSWSKEYINMFKGVYNSPSKHRKLERVPVKFEVNDLDRVYVVWAEWTSGNSFGFGKGMCVEVMGILKEEDEAYAMKDRLERNDWPYKLPWIGYFESLDEIHVDRARING